VNEDENENTFVRHISSENVTHLNAGEIFVFGSNIAGRHGRYAAKQAREHFGAIYGCGRGLQGQSYAIPTMNANIKPLPYAEICIYINEFVAFANAHPNMKFLVTRVGCGSAGYTDEQMAIAFKMAALTQNIYLPRKWWEVLLG
jgi:hypothetical protein